MHIQRATGPGASALKYDILTALSLLGLHGSKRDQIAMPRLIALVTARYDWRQDRLSTGQSDMARMWGVTPRTVKREIKHWLEQGYLICVRPGVKGRVAQYRLNVLRVANLTEAHWPLVGSDYAARMARYVPVSDAPNVVTVNFDARSKSVDTTEPHPRGKNRWDAVQARLAQLHPELTRHWLSKLRMKDDDGRRIMLTAPTPFATRYIETHLMRHLAEAVEAEIGPMRRIVLRPARDAHPTPDPT